MPLNKTRKRLVRRLKRQETKRLIKKRNWELFKDIFLETREANFQRLLVAGSPFRGGKVLSWASWREY